MGKSKKHHHHDDDDDSVDEKEHSHHRHARDPCLPPHGKTYLTIGQDLYSIQEYLDEQRNATLHWYMKAVSHPRSIGGNSTKDDDDDDDDHYETRMPVPRPDTEVPAAIMVYTDIQKLKGLDQPTDYGTGIEYADGALRLASPPNNKLGIGLQVGLWLGGASGCRDVISGKLDDKVDRLVHYLGDKCPASKIFLRIGYEFDNPDFGYSTDPESYKLAFEYIVNKCQKKKSCRGRTVMVWHSWAGGLPGNATLEDFYPGDHLVDWIGVSVFQQFYPNKFGGSVEDLQNVLDFADQHYKPTMIAESTPFGGIHNNPILGEGADIWKAWFEPTINLIKDYDIGMWSYINCNWEVQPLWHGVGFGDTRVSIDSSVMEKWYNFVTGSRRFIRATDYEFCAADDELYKPFDEDGYPFKSKHHKYRHDYDDDDYHHRHKKHHHSSDRQEGPRGRSVWGHQRVVGGDGLWETVLPLVMVASSLAIVVFMFLTSKRRRKTDRTPRRQRVRFAFLDAKEDDDDGSFALYGSICSPDSDSSRWRNVRRVGRNLILDNTADGTTVVA